MQNQNLNENRNNENRDENEKHDADTAGRIPDRVLTAEDLARPAPTAGEGFEGARGAGREAVVPDPREAPKDGPREEPPAIPIPLDIPQPLPQDEPQAVRRDEPRDEPQAVPRGVPGTDPADSVHAVGSDEEPLMGTAGAERYRARWGEIQGRFVDDPQEAVREADTLMAEVVQSFADTLSEHRSGLGKQWEDRGEQVATEDLRQTLQAYRSLVNRLLDT
ncbi:hypothetical protein ACIA8F_15950 [Streptomyces sp. NPDC051563]|uniref:hypothetical protein n=1 Tax=Streptomyces sp. NPDC051563 TaxID=3365659 RepID=UPI0037880631